MSLVWAGALLSFVLGALAGLSELISRYRDEPFSAAANIYGGGYLTLNGVLAAAAYGLLARYPKQILAPLSGDPIMMALTAGFGAMAIFRSKLFIFKAEDGKEYPIGPSIVMETFLGLLDRKIDRRRAAARQRRVFDSLKDVGHFKDVADYLEASLLSFQNLTQQEKSDIAAVIRQYKEQTAWPEALRIMAVGFAFLTIAGEENFDEVIEGLKKYLAMIHLASSATATVAPALRP
jgi:hypothetical protein